MYNAFTELVQSLYGGTGTVALHAPVFAGNEKKYLADCIDSTFVSYVGKYVTRFEELTAAYTGAKHAVAVVNGTAALQIALQTAGVASGDEVITQALTFVATANAITHAGAVPVFIDVDLDTMGMSPERLASFLTGRCTTRNGVCINTETGRKITAVVPMHTFGHPCRIDEIVAVASSYGVPVIEDAAEALGSFHHGRHAGTFGVAGILSYNGNKTITTGGGGMILTDDESFARRVRHSTTTAKIPHPWEFAHDEAAYNLRMPNINAALGCAQMESLPLFLRRKREVASAYEKFFTERGIAFVAERAGTTANYWLNCIVLKDRVMRDEFLQFTNAHGIMTRPCWRLMNTLPMYEHCQADDLEHSTWLEARLVNIPSSVLR